MFVIVKVPEDGANAKSADMKDILAPRLGAIDALNRAVRYAVEHKFEIPFAKEFANGLYGTSMLQFSNHEGEPYPAGHDAASAENVKGNSRDIFVTVISDHVSPQTMHEIVKLIAVLSDTDRDIHVNII